MFKEVIFPLSFLAHNTVNTSGIGQGAEWTLAVSEDEYVFLKCWALKSDSNGEAVWLGCVRAEGKAEQEKESSLRQQTGSVGNKTGRS